MVARKWNWQLWETVILQLSVAWIQVGKGPEIYIIQGGLETAEGLYILQFKEKSNGEEKDNNFHKSKYEYKITNPNSCQT